MLGIEETKENVEGSSGGGYEEYRHHRQVDLTVGHGQSDGACAISACTFYTLSCYCIYFQQINYTLQACMCRTKHAWAVREIAN